MANNLNFAQISTVLNAIYQQATGQQAIGIADTTQFVSVAQTVLKTGYDNVLQAISQVLSRTIFSVRPYNAKFKNLMVDSQKFGNHVRKINYLDLATVNNDELPTDPESQSTPTAPLTDGNSIDQWTIKKPKVIQTNFYGGTTYARYITRFKDQLDVAFSGPEELSRFWSGVMTSLSNQIEQDHEIQARACIGNLIAGVFLANNGYQIVNLLTEYNTLTGQSLTKADVYKSANFKAFVQWMFSRVNKACRFLEERTSLYHQNISAGTIMRHTPMANLKTFMLEDFKQQLDMMALADTYHDNYLKLATNEGVAFWQAPTTPDEVLVKPVTLKSDGSLKEDNDSVAVTDLVGVLMDEEAAGMTIINEWSMATPINARGGYSNIWYHWTDRYWNDFTENVIILRLA